MPTAKIPLTQGLVTLVDAEDFQFLRRYSWFAMKQHSDIYYAGTTQIHKGKISQMHNVLFPPPQGYYVDHINHNGLDNRRRNFEHVTRAENIRRGRYAPGASGIRGIYMHPCGKWHVRLSVEGTRHSGGYFSTLEAAEDALTALKKKFLYVSSLR